MSWTSFFSSLEGAVWGGGATWFYHNTIGAATTFFQNATLSASEAFSEGILAGILAVFGSLLNWFASLFGGVMDMIVNLSSSIGIWDAPLVVGIIILIGGFGLLMIEFAWRFA